MKVELDHIIDLLLEGGNTAPTAMMIDKGDFITRVRPGWGHRKALDLSYPHEIERVRMQRANIEKSPVFYGTMSDDNEHLENTRFIAIAESSELLRNTKSGGEPFTCGRWRTKRPVLALSFVTENTYPAVNNSLLAALRTLYSQKANLTNEQRNIMERLNKEFTKVVKPGNEKEYLLTATLCHYLMYERTYSGLPIEAIVYPSVQTGGVAGVNIAIRPDVADEALMLDRVLEVNLHVEGLNGHVENVRGLDAEFNEVWREGSV